MDLDPLLLVGLLGVFGWFLWRANSGALQPAPAAPTDPGGGVTPQPYPNPSAPGPSPMPASPQPQPSSQEADTFARTLYGEARGESTEGKLAVANVIRNRVQSPGFPNTYSGVCLEQVPGHPSYHEFSCWNASDPNRRIIVAVTTANTVFRQCLALAEAVMAGAYADNTGGATFYHTNSIATPASWGAMTKTATIGNQSFYRPSSFNVANATQNFDPSRQG